jgi:hypothetical protein
MASSATQKIGSQERQRSFTAEVFPWGGVIFRQRLAWQATLWRRNASAMEKIDGVGKIQKRKKEF